MFFRMLYYWPLIHILPAKLHNVITFCFCFHKCEKRGQEAPLTLAARMPLFLLAAGKSKTEELKKTQNLTNKTSRGT